MSSPTSIRRRGDSSRQSQSSTPARSQQPQISSPLFFRSSPAVGDQNGTPRASRQAPPPGKCRVCLLAFRCSLLQILLPSATAQVPRQTPLLAAVAPLSSTPVDLPDSHLRRGYRPGGETYTRMHLRPLQPSAGVYLLAKMACQLESPALKPRSPT